MTLVWASGLKGIYDYDAIQYVNAVEAADGQSLEYEVACAINNFVVGCKADGVWNAIKESCILAGARTVAGALVTLKGTPSPTNVGPFVSTDYSRKLGLKGNGTTKALVSNRRIFDDSQNNCHISYFATTVLDQYAMGTHNTNLTGSMHIIGDTERCRYFTTAGGSGAVVPNALRGISRSNSADYVSRNGGISTTRTSTSQAPAQNWYYGILGTASSTGTVISYNSSRIAFYSIGEALNLALLDARVSTLMTDIGAAIP